MTNLKDAEVGSFGCTMLAQIFIVEPLQKSQAGEKDYVDIFSYTQLHAFESD